MLLEDVQRRATAMLNNIKVYAVKKDTIIGITTCTLEYGKHRSDLIQVYRLLSGIQYFHIVTGSVAI